MRSKKNEIISSNTLGIEHGYYYFDYGMKKIANMPVRTAKEINYMVKCGLIS